MSSIFKTLDSLPAQASLAAFTLVLVLVSCLWTRYKPHLRKIPGPTLASFSNLWKIAGVLKQDMPWRNIAAHEKYGPLVRIGPNHVSTSDPEALKVIYGFVNVFRKSAFFTIGEAWYEGKKLPTLFTTQSNEYHAQLKRASARAFTMTSIAALEPYVSTCVDLFLSRIGEVTDGGKTAIDITPWLQYYAFDVLGEVNFGRQLGFLKSGTDVNKNIEGIEVVLKYVSLIGQTPQAHEFLIGNPLLPKLFPNFEKVNQVQEFAVAMIKERQKNPVDRKDILARLLEVHDKDPTQLSFRELVAITTTNIIAGSDTTAITLRAVFYYLSKNGTAYSALQQEIDLAISEKRLSSPATYNECAQLPYLSAVINEAMRIHPATGFILERLVPPGGTYLSGVFLPENTVVGANSWVMHHNKSVFGEDVDVFRPERWLEGSEAQKAEMQRCMIAFGAGPRACIGKHISLMEMWKVVADTVRTFDFQLEDPGQVWKLYGSWFVKQGPIPMMFRRRRGTFGA
ncbi:MAG: hypothetical protein Q9192_002703 [Flavoplaca navasiana]